MAHTHLEWSTFEYHYHEKSADWFWAVGIIAISIAATSLILGNILFAIFIVVAAFALCIVATKKPHLMECRITDRGVILNNMMYPYETIESFWVEDHTHLAELHNIHHTPKMFIKSKRFFMPYIIVPIDSFPPETVRDVLFNFLPEEEHMEPLSQKIMERLGF